MTFSPAKSNSFVIVTLLLDALGDWVAEGDENGFGELLVAGCNDKMSLKLIINKHFKMSVLQVFTE